MSQKNLNKKEIDLLARFLESEQGKQILDNAIKKAIDEAIEKFNQITELNRPKLEPYERDPDWWKLNSDQSQPDLE
jgi:hypothetical protein